MVPCRSRTARKDPDRTDRTCKTQPQLLQDCPWLFSPQVTPITRFVPIVIGCRSWKSIAFGFDRPTIIGKPLRPQQRFVSWSAFGRGIWCWRNFFVKLFACMMGLGPQFLAHIFYLRIHLVRVNYKESNACSVKLKCWFGRTYVTITVRIVQLCRVLFGVKWFAVTMIQSNMRSSWSHFRRVHRRFKMKFKVKYTLISKLVCKCSYYCEHLSWTKMPSALPGLRSPTAATSPVGSSTAQVREGHGHLRRAEKRQWILSGREDVRNKLYMNLIYVLATCLLHDFSCRTFFAASEA